MKRGRTLTRCAVILALMMPLAAWSPPAAAQVSFEEAHAIGVDAYLYFYPLITMDLTRRQLTNVEPGKGGLGGPPNTFVNIPEYPSADMKVVVRPNFDTLYSSAWLDLTEEPVIVSVPDTNGRYYLLPMLDMWTNVFASPGWRTTGTQAGNFAIIPPGWHLGQSKLPEGVQAIYAPRPTSGSSAAPRPMARRTTRPCTRFRQVSRSRRCRSGARRPSRSRSISIRASI